MFHLSVKPVSRTAGRSSVAAAAYRGGCSLVDERTGEIHDYTRKGGIEYSEIIIPPGAGKWAQDRAVLWNEAEAAEVRKDARVAREFEIALPKELSKAEGIELAREFAGEISEAYGVAVDIAVHKDHAQKWDGTEKGFQGYHAHLLATTRKVEATGLGEKSTIELSDSKRRSLGLGSGADEIERIRQKWETTANRHLALAGHDQRIDRRTLKEQGVNREATVHLGPKATAAERAGRATDLGEINRRIEQAYLQGLADRAALRVVNPQVVDIETRLSQALAEKETVAMCTDKLANGARSFKAEFGVYVDLKQNLEQIRQQEAQKQEKERKVRLQQQSKGIRWSL